MWRPKEPSSRDLLAKAGTPLHQVRMRCKRVKSPRESKVTGRVRALGDTIQSVIMSTFSLIGIFAVILSVSGKEEYAQPDFNLSTAPLPHLEYLRKVYPQVKLPVPLRETVGEPLLLTPYIEQRRIEEAKALAEVDTEYLLDDIPSYAGYLTVDSVYNSNIWFWYFPVEGGSVEDNPLLVWLQGGPGASSLFGLFEELGPFKVAEEGDTLIENPYSWHKNHSVVFFDNPVGTGFSFTDTSDGLATNQSQIAEQLYDAFVQFLRLFPELQKVPFFISGESYAGKHIPSVAYEIHKRNPTAELKINLEGLAIGNGFIDPASLVHYSAFALQLGFIDNVVATKMEYYEKLTGQYLSQGDTIKAFIVFNQVLNILMYKSDLTNIYNFLDEGSIEIDGQYASFIQKPEIRKSLHVGNTEWTSIGKVYNKLIPDFMNSVKPLLEELLNSNYRIMCYGGQMDIIVAYPLSVNTYRNLNWKGSDAYLKAEQKPWYDDGKVIGYIKQVGNFTEIMVRNAGHMVPTQQPARSLTLINSFTRNIPLQTHNDEDNE